jgi:transcriptional regulator GlxA family with amidase domain
MDIPLAYLWIQKNLMKKLAIIFPDGTTTLSSLILTIEVIAKANEYFINKGNNPILEITLVGSEKMKKISSTFSIQLDKSTSDSYNPDLIIIPSLGDDLELALRRNKKIIEWVSKQYKRGAEVASLCTGAFILGAAGILNGKSCSTHWGSAHVFRKMFPEVILTIDKIITDERGIYTSGGAISAMNLVLHLIGKYYNRETAIYCSKVFQIEIERDNQSEFIIFSGQKNHEDEQIKSAQLFIENNVSDKIVIEKLSSRFSIDRRNFDRRFKKATGNTPHEYMQRVKVEAAKKYLETSRKTINEVMYEVGYSDVRAFREVFRRVTGMSPVEYKNRYN